MINKLCWTIIGIIIGWNGWANISVPAIFGDHMVLQQQEEVTFWGWGKPHENVEISVSWDTSQVHQFTVNNQSRWEVDLITPAAGGPYNITIKGHNTIILDDVLIGEVWLGSGQSNMEWPPSAEVEQAEEEKAIANFPEIRFFTVSVATAHSPQQHLSGKWVKCTPEEMWNFSAVMYFFGKELHQNLNVPVGLIHSSWGGTPAEVWIDEDVLNNDRVLRENATLLEEMSWSPKEPGIVYNAMLHPLIPFRIKGVLWYQGETNTGNAPHYARTLKLLIESWRSAWGYDFSFYYAQIAPYTDYGEDNVNGAIVRNQQRKVLDMVSNTGMIVTSDIGNLADIHPRNKIDVGRRLAAWAFTHDYGLQGFPVSGPLYQSYEVENDKVKVQFDYVYNGLKAEGGSLKEFEVLDGSGKWHEAIAKIEMNHIVVKSERVAQPLGVRFGYSNASDPNLFNQEGLPASCFEVIFNRSIK